MSSLQAGTIVQPGVYTATQTTGAKHNEPPVQGIKVFVDVTNSNHGSIAPVVFWTDQNGIDYVALSGLPITNNGQTVLTIHPSLTAVSNITANDSVPKNFHVDVQALNASGVTYSASYSMLA